MNKFSLNFIHRFLAIALIAPLMWLAITGALLEFSAETDRIFSPELLSIPQTQKTDLSWSMQLPDPLKVAKSDEWVRFSPSTTPFDPSVWERGDGQSFYVNPQDATLRGQRASTAGMQFFLLRLHTGDFLDVQWVYRWFAWAASAGLAVILLSGLFNLRRTRDGKMLSTHSMIGALGTVPMMILLLGVAIMGFVTSSQSTAYLHNSTWQMIDDSLPFKAQDLIGWDKYSQRNLSDCKPVFLNRPESEPRGLSLHCADGRVWTSSTTDPANGSWVSETWGQLALTWHTGVFLGQAGRILWVLAALAVPLLWWSRQRQTKITKG